MIDNLLGLKETSRDDITAILDDAVKLKNDVLEQDIKKSNILSGKSIITLFFENSTRTRVSFELASKYLGATAANISAGGSSISYGNRSAVDFCENFTPFSIVACCRFEFGRLKYDFRK